MRTSLLAVVIAAGVALVTGGSVRNLPTERPRWWWLVPLAVMVLAASWVARSAATPLTVAALVALVAFAAANLPTVGMAVVLAGLVLNLVVILANGAMLVDPGAVVASDVAPSAELASLDLGPSRRWREPGDRFGVLGDIVPVAPLAEVVSFGDLILAAGLANVTLRLLRPRSERPSPSPWRRRAPRHRKGALVSTPSPAGSPP